MNQIIEQLGILCDETEELLDEQQHNCPTNRDILSMTYEDIRQENLDFIRRQEGWPTL